MAEPMQVESESESEEVPEEVQCPVELECGTCTDPNCRKWQTCPGFNCGCRGKRWHPPEQYRYMRNKRCLECRKGRELHKERSKTYNPRNNPRRTEAQRRREPRRRRNVTARQTHASPKQGREKKGSKAKRRSTRRAPRPRQEDRAEEVHRVGEQVDH